MSGVFSSSIFAALLTAAFIANPAAAVDAIPKAGDPGIVAIDYGDRANWLYLPETAEKPVDVFYLYPAAWTRRSEGEPPLAAIDHIIMRMTAAGLLMEQASAFAPAGNIHAPFYRQLEAAFLRGLPEAERAAYEGGLPLADVTAAFERFLETYNDGRPFILAAHGQGSALALALLADHLRDRPEALDRLVAAYLIGHSVTEADLAANPHLKFAEGSDDTGVIVSYNTEAEGYTGPNPALRPGALAINPISWTRGEEPAPADRNLGSRILQDGAYVTLHDFADARVDLARGVVRTATPDPAVYNAGDAWSESYPPGVYHLFDYGFFYYNLMENAENRAQAFIDARWEHPDGPAAPPTHRPHPAPPR